ncbi:SPOR domain-containing protein [Bowmanella yangjiangensis]|uniref:SPOR domain-containing protein n=1 Tax=Bowmanella yangjiangensis TaxID=2811230 RepID=A0ABS3CTL4_9ALTE|nr:hypothetical protein [Bowmanella yangjiangensis]MBN7819625.1 hypothetical protein [Bowmanella yangjiangensis]
MQRAFVDLHKRLSHLTSFTSGLIFVAGEGAGHQQAFAGEFLANQDDEFNLAYIKASEGKDIAYFRQALVNQLMGNISLDPRRPLPQTLQKLLDKDPQPMMICISAADLLPDELVGELWHVVQQLHEQRFCVILFGSRHWTERVKPSLSGSVLPIQVNYDFTEQDALSGTELERMIAQKRQAFNARLAARQVQVEPVSAKRPAILLRLLVLITFAICFSSVLGWFYKDELMAYWVQSDEQKTAVLAVQSEPETLAPIPEILAAQEPQATVIETSATAVDENNVNSELPLSDSATSDELVADWQSQADKIQPPSVPVAVEVKPEENTADTTVNDALASESIARPSDTEESLPAAQDDQEESPVSLTYPWNEAEVLALAANRFVLQLSAASDASLLSNFIQANQLEATTWRYETRRYGGSWYVLLSNQSFDSLEQARAYASSLSASVQAENPFAKTVRQVQEEIQLLGMQ